MSGLHIGPILRSLGRKKARSLLTVSMTVLTFAVVVNCLLFISAQQEKLNLRSGVDDAHLVFLSVSNFDAAIEDSAQVINRIQQDLELLRNTPGVVDATSTRFQPWRGGGSSATNRRVGEKDMEPVRAQVYSAGPELARTLNISIAGQALVASEMNNDDVGLTADRPASAVVSRKFAEEIFPGTDDALGKLFVMGTRYTMRVVGIIDEFYNPYAWNIEEKVVFYPGFQGNAVQSTFLVRVDDQRLQNLAGIEEALLKDSPLRGIQTRTIPETRRRYEVNERMTARVLSVVIGLMVFITSVSIMGLTAASVASRRREIGTRRALGATRLAVMRHFLAENIILTGIGLTLGVVAAYGLNIALVDSMGVPRLAWPWVVLPAIIVAVVNAVAAWQPARRASAIPPAIATKAV